MFVQSITLLVLVHKELVSLTRLAPQRRKVACTQAFLAWQRDGQKFTWSGSVRGAALEGIVADGQEAGLTAISLGGRTVSGRAIGMQPEGLAGLLAFAGSGALIVAGREL